jgi:hypothetical protein
VILPQTPRLYQNGMKRGEVRHVGWVGDYSHVVFGKKFPGEKGIMRQSIVMIQQLFILSPKFGAKSSHIFTKSL